MAVACHGPAESAARKPARHRDGAPKGATPWTQGVHFKKVAPIGAPSPSHWRGTGKTGLPRASTKNRDCEALAF
jgi:hypothetical protein